MSSSSTTACSRSPSPSPATPESTDSPDTVFNQDDLSTWCKSISPSGYLVDDEARLSDASKVEQPPLFELEDLLQNGAFQDASPPGLDGSLVLDPRILSKLAVPHGNETANVFVVPHNSINDTQPVPPPLSQPRPDPVLTSQRIVYPPKQLCYNLPIMIPSIPEGGTKSRVETQVRLTVDLAHASSSTGEPLKYDRVGTWRWLRLPRGTSTKKRTRKEGKVDAPPEDTLFLTAEVTCSSAPHTRVTCCSSCQTREAKRVARKIAARVRPARSDTESQDEAPVIPGRGKHEDKSNIVQFNCPEVLDFSYGSVVLPLRITCYCRHHREKIGFNVHFTMLDHSGRVVGTGISRPIMITDDHKTTGASAQRLAQAAGVGDVQQSPEWPLGDSSETGQSMKRKKPRVETGLERTKKRTKPYDVQRSFGRAVRRGSTASLDSPSYVTSAAATRASSPLQSIMQSPMSPFTVEPETPHMLDSTSVQETSDSLASAFDFSSPIGVHSPIFDPDIVMTQQFDADTLSSFQQLAVPFGPSSSPSAASLTLDPAQTLNVPSQVASLMLFDQNPPPPISNLPAPRIHRLIPASGPTYGGIEVTVLGANFHPSMQLNCVFGGTAASSTQRWSENTLVCMLPPRATPGVVTVWFEGMQKGEDGIPPCLFTYHDETDRALMELALQVVGLKMTGKIEDARNVAMRIVGNTDTEGSSSGTPTSGNSSNQLANAVDVPLDLRHLLLSRTSNGDFESILLDFLSILDLAMDEVPNLDYSAISHQTSSGQTLLHLATMAKFPALMRSLIDHDIDIDARDKNGCTALFCAAIVQSVECAKVLVDAGAALDVVNALGKTPVEAAPAGFFEFASLDADRCDGDDRLINQDEEEAAWGDVEEESESDVESKSLSKRRLGRKLPMRRRRSSHRLAEVDSKQRQSPRSSEKKALEAGLPDEKQVASFMETLSRTLAQWQHPQDMISNMPNLPLPHLPNLPGIPVWNALPQMPAVFPVFIPIPALSALWGDKRAGEKESVEDDKNAQAQPRLAMSTIQDWRAFCEKWMTQVALTPRASEESDAPPAYSPRSSDGIDVQPSLKATEPIASSSAVRHPDKGVSRHLVHETVPVPEQQVQSYGYRPAHKARKQQKKHDRMLVLFWIPILMIGVVWAFFHFMRVAFHATRAVLTFKAGLKV
ncbi:uncharacterized protein LAESUDRAFT_692924 [Laetiporus sulphureus 93-53]|uniref:IPT/TIG domain-containing protein n=1 Tax=Laetiporus sulphureus 93-53 TaxID=1314785 RepID=A0A165GQN3_9APHY|nr:uncharacterized protein LAESUDRAFT_692924 [Laetiporus sulphureus 93-53]KZT10672.1 hypothetical protein LAESUDRAFT_692924 [Laetiporus sulphureus 93-53]